MFQTSLNNILDFTILIIQLLCLWFQQAKEGDILDSLGPGEEVEVQVTVKYAFNPNAGHWSSWSHPVRAVVPQYAGVSKWEKSLNVWVGDKVIAIHSSASHPVNSSVTDAIHECKMFFSFSDDISLTCYTSDLQNITCQWNGSRYGEENEYKLLYKMDRRYITYITYITTLLIPPKQTDVHFIRL